MATNIADLEASPDAVWAVLADSDSYADWVVGAKEIRGTSGNWPEVGSALHHTLGAGPAAVIKDKTEVIECTEGQHLLLRAKMRPLGQASVDLRLRPKHNGTEVVMTEKFDGGLLGKLYGRVASSGVKARNAEALRRLGNLADKR